jgi:hypothetical protein
MSTARARPYLVALLLAALVLLAQAAALAHGVTHGLEPAHEPACEQCLGFAPLGAGLVASPMDWTPPDLAPPEALPAPASRLASFVRTYRSRAPPRA